MRETLSLRARLLVRHPCRPLAHRRTSGPCLVISTSTRLRIPASPSTILSSMVFRSPKRSQTWLMILHTILAPPAHPSLVQHLVPSHITLPHTSRPQWPASGLRPLRDGPTKRRLMDRHIRLRSVPPSSRQYLHLVDPIIRMGAAHPHTDRRLPPRPNGLGAPPPLRTNLLHLRPAT